ncbi:MAG: DNA gyrase subunit A [Polyangiaceae bacterium]
MPLVEGSGNFGSLDGDPAAAMRYTECRLATPATELLTELSQDTVHFRPNYDGTKEEPVVLPAKLPNLLINGSTGIAVGMATNIPPHNLGRNLRRRGAPAGCAAGGQGAQQPRALPHGKGAGLPRRAGNCLDHGGDKAGLRDRPGRDQAARHLEAWQHRQELQDHHHRQHPFAVNKSTLVERIAEVVTSRKMPLILDVRDISGEDVAIELELKSDAEEAKVLAYLYKNTPLQQNFNVNLTCLVPTENPEVGRPERLDLQSILWHFLQFRLEVVTRRLQHELGQLERRMHILEGFVKVFDALTEIISIIRKSDGKADAAKKIIQRFRLDEEQTDAILELRLYRLARLEILIIQDELKNKKKRASEIKKLLSGPAGRWAVVKDELIDVGRSLGAAGRRRTLIEAVEDEPEFSAEDLIVAEDSQVLLTSDGWVKRQREIKDISKVRLREGDQILSWIAGSTRATVCFFSNFGTAYTRRIIDIPATTGYGEPIQKLFKLKDGEAIVSAMSFRPAPDRRARRQRRALPGDLRRRRVDGRLRPVLRPRAVRRAEHALRAPLRQAGQGTPHAQRRDRERHRDADRRLQGPPCAALRSDRGELPVRRWQGRDADEARQGRRADRVPRGKERRGHADAQDEPRRRTAREPESL